RADELHLKCNRTRVYLRLTISTARSGPPRLAAQEPGIPALQRADRAVLDHQLVGRHAAIVPVEADRLAVDDVAAALALALEGRRGAGRAADRVGRVPRDEAALVEVAGAIEVERGLDPDGGAAARPPEAARDQLDVAALRREEPGRHRDRIDARAQAGELLGAGQAEHDEHAGRAGDRDRATVDRRAVRHARELHDQR